MNHELLRHSLSEEIRLGIKFDVIVTRRREIKELSNRPVLHINPIEHLTRRNILYEGSREEHGGARNSYLSSYLCGSEARPTCGESE